MSAGQQGDVPQAAAADGFTATAVIATRASTPTRSWQVVAAAVALAVSRPKATRVHQCETDWQLDQQRHKIENLFSFMKH